uniref:MIF4G domain-containing protein n=1 Tax=Trypanosoma vivax (strain Y486) TaxID=1055687 RepID=G0UBJ9_TRYVY|nr:conserved hypothetical protein, fragment [Trypanosoma vivax Y486]
MTSIAELLQQRAVLRERNRNVDVQRSAFADRSNSLKSDLKKATALAKRFKSYSAESSEKTILAQLDTVSFGMFISEAAQGAVQSLCPGTRMKPGDAHSFAVVCSEVHQRYDGFWSMVQKELKANADKIIGVESLKLALERLEEVGATGLSCTGDAATVTSSGATSSGAGTTAELVGLLTDAKPLMNLLKLLNNLTEKRAAMTTSPIAVVTVMSITTLLIREVGIELLGTSNGALSHLRPAGSVTERGPESLRELTGHCGPLKCVSSGKDGKEAMFLLGPAGFRLQFNAATKLAGPVDEATAQQAEEASWLRLGEARTQTVSPYSTEEERRQFFLLALASARTCLKAYERRKETLESWWHASCDTGDSKGKGTRSCQEDPHFRALQEQVERLYVICDNLLGMMGFVAPLPVDLTVAEPKAVQDVTITSASKKFYAVVGAETLNRFENDEQRTFYEYVPDFLDVSAELMQSLVAEKVNWDMLLRRKGLCAPVAALGSFKEGGQAAEEASVETDAEQLWLTTRLESADRGKLHQSAEEVPLVERWHIRLAGLAVPAAHFEEYTPVLQLLDKLVECQAADAIDSCCEEYVQQSLAPILSSPENAVTGRVFFTNCRVLLTTELRYPSNVLRPHMLRFMARCAALLNQYFPDVGEFLAEDIKCQWKMACGASSAVCDETVQMHVTNIVRYLCDLTKFDVVPSSCVFGILRAAIEDLRHRCSVSAITTIMQHGGLFLSRNRATRSAMSKLLDKLKEASRETGLKGESLRLIKSSLAFLKPPQPQQQPVAQAVQTPLEMYVRHLMSDVLSPSKLDFVYEKLLKMPWNDPPTREMLTRVLRQVYRLKWDNIPLFADMLSALARSGYSSVVLCIADAVAEDMRRDLEACSPLATPPAGAVGTSAVKLHPSCRPMQWRLVDCVFVANLFRSRVLSFRLLGYMTALMLLYTPQPLFGTDYSRLRCCVTLLTECASFLLWEHRGRGSRSAERIAGLHQFVRKLMALLFVHRYTLKEPIPMDLRYDVEDLVAKLNEHMRKGGVLGSETLKRVAARWRRGQQDDVDSHCAQQELPTLPLGIELPKTPEEADVYAKAVAAEPIFPANLWLEKTCEAVKRSCREDVPHCRILGLNAREGVEFSACASNAAESTDGVSIDMLPECGDDVDEGTGFNEGEGSCSSCETSYESGRGVDESCDDGSSSGSNSDEAANESESSSSSGDVIDDSSSEYEDSGSDFTEEELESDDTEGSEEESEELEETEEEDGSFEDVEEDEEEEEEEIEETREQSKIAAAEALRLRLEEADLDAELRALMSENPRDAALRAASVAARGGAAERLMEQDLVTAIRHHRQLRLGQASSSSAPLQPSSQPPSLDASDTVKFTILRRPVRNMPTAGKSGVSTAPTTTNSTGGAASAAGGGTSGVFLAIPRGTEFAENALRLQEQQRRQQEELREITRRINRMQEEERYS